VNISGQIRKILLKKLNNLDENEFEYLTIFDKSIEEVRRNMRDTLSRIPRTELNKWASNSKIKIGSETRNKIFKEKSKKMFILVVFHFKNKNYLFLDKLDEPIGTQMNSTNSTDDYRIQFFPYDGIFLGFQIPVAALFIFGLLLQIFCIREKPISRRGIIPFFSFLGILIFDIRMYGVSLSFFKTDYVNSYTY
jgi:hypothetical protein